MSFVRRLRDAWRALPAEYRLCGVGALVLLGTMLLPWYSTSRGVAVPQRGAQLVQDSQTALRAFSFVEAAVLLVALGVLALLFARGERRAFHLPGGDGTVIAGAGAWAALLIVWRLFDKPSLGQGVSVGLEWGIFVALGAAIGLAVAGNRLRAARRPEPPLAAAGPVSARPRPPGEAVAVRVPDERPHLEETRAMGSERPHLAETRVMPERAPLSREAAARDTADFGAVPARDEAVTEPVRGDDAATEPVRRDRKDTGRGGAGAGRGGGGAERGDDQPTLPGMPD